MTFINLSLSSKLILAITFLVLLQSPATQWRAQALSLSQMGSSLRAGLQREKSVIVPPRTSSLGAMSRPSFSRASSSFKDYFHNPSLGKTTTSVKNFFSRTPSRSSTASSASSISSSTGRRSPSLFSQSASQRSSATSLESASSQSLKSPTSSTTSLQRSNAIRRRSSSGSSESSMFETPAKPLERSNAFRRQNSGTPNLADGQMKMGTAPVRTPNVQHTGDLPPANSAKIENMPTMHQGSQLP